MTGKGSCEGPEQLQADAGKDWKMSYYRKTIVPNIEAHYKNLSAVEKNIADFFISNEEDMDFSSRHISSMLYVSEASLSRFAKKCGYKGYREFVFKYKESFGEKDHQITGQMREVFDSYQELLNKSYNLADEAQLRRIAGKMSECRRVFVYGKGSSSLAAREMQFRFMRLGLDMDAVDETHMMRFHSTIVQEDCMAIGISISGRTEEVMECLKQAHRQGAYTVLLTANDRPEYSEFCEEVVCLAAKKNLDFGNIISPQYPILVMTDILYGYYLEIDSSVKQARHDNSVMLLKSRQIQDKDEGGEGKQ